MPRISRDHMFMEMAETAARRGTCDRAQVGAVIIVDRRPISMGYNGAPPGHKHCDEVGHDVPNERPGWYKKWVHLGDWMGGTPQRPLPDMEDVVEGCQRAVHAEANAIAWAARHGVSTFGGEMYCTHSPCKTCAELILASGIGRFVYRRSYRAERLDLLNHIEVVQLND